jgi:hypothetical protein
MGFEVTRRPLNDAKITPGEPAYFACNTQLDSRTPMLQIKWNLDHAHVAKDILEDAAK